MEIRRKSISLAQRYGLFSIHAACSLPEDEVLQSHANADISNIEQSPTNTSNARGLNLTAFRPATIQVVKTPF